MKLPALAWCMSGWIAAGASLGQVTLPKSESPALKPSGPIQFDPASRPKEPEVPVQVLLGRRVGALREAAAQLSTVVLVSDADSYLAAISAWRPDRRFPVLIDDGSAQAREDIARFVRAYKPAGVVRWTMPPAAEAPKTTPTAFNKIEPARYFAAVQKAWNVATPSSDQKALLDGWKAAAHRPPGVVVTSAGDTTWAAAMALAIAWGQPTILVPVQPGNIDWSITPSEADTLATAIEKGCEDSGFPWNKLGDDIEAVTLALNCAERLSRTTNESLALTDRIGRLGSQLDAKERWAWAGHIFGAAPRSVYWAMCSVFLQPTSAWLFDGYPDGPPWDGYDATAAANILKETGMAVEVMDKPRGSAHAWRLRASTPVDAGLIMVNTRGNADYFDLEPGQCKPGDVPILTVPAAVSMVHSWSMLFPGKRDLLGGRWLERGAFCYAGSVNEPFLQAFVRTPSAAGRFATGAPWGTCVRIDEARIWKIAVLGDPLYAFAPKVKRSAEALPLEGATPIADGLKELFAAEKFLEGVRIMDMLGRDADIARLASAMIDAKPEKVDSALAAACILPAFRADKGPLVARLFARMSMDDQKDPVLRDALWLSAYPRLEKPDDDALLTLLKSNVRTEQLERDTSMLASAWTARFGAASTGTLFADWRAKFTEKDKREALEKAAKSGWVWGRQ